MKKLFILLLMAIGINCFGQFGKSVQLMGEGTLEGLDSVLIHSKQMSQTNGFIGIQLVIDTVATGAGSPTAIAKASLKDLEDPTDWGTLTTQDYIVYTNNNDTVDISIPGGSLWGISGLPFDYVGVYLKTEAGDTLNYKAYWVGKEY